MSEQVTIFINLDETNVDESLANIEKKAQDTGKKIGESLETSIEIPDKSDDFDRMKKSADALGNSLLFVADNFGAITTAGAVTVVLKNNFRALAAVGTDLGKTITSQSKGFFGLAANAGKLYLALTALSEVLKTSDSQGIRFLGTISKISAIVLGGFSAAVAIATVKIGQFANQIGTRLVVSFEELSDKFAKAESQAIVFTKIIENFNQITNGASGTVESWTNTIGNLSEELRLSVIALQKSSAEIVAVTSKMGLAESQMQNLLKISAEYAKINRKDLFETTVKFVNALNGNAVAVQAFGVKLGQAATQQFALKKGIDRGLASLSEAEKVQLRYNSLLAQYDNIAGVAAATTGTLSDANDRYRANLERLNTALGEGASIIENNNLAAFALNKILDNVNSTVVKAAGFFGALGARVLQIGGFFLEWSFKVFAVTQALKLLNVFLSSDLFQTNFVKPIPFVNQSLSQLIGLMGATTGKIKSVSDVFKVLGSIAATQLNRISIAILGVEARAITLGTVFRGVFTRILQVINLLTRGMIVLVSAAFTPLGLAIIAIGGSIALLIRGFQELEARTGVFTDLFNILVGIFEDSKSVFQPVIDLFKSFKKEIFELANKAFGVFVVALAEVIKAITKLVAANPFGAFSDDTITAIAGVNFKLSQLSKNIQRVGFDMSKLKTDTGRAVAGVNNNINKVNLQALASLRQELANVGKGQEQILKEQLSERLRLLQNARNEELLTQTQFNELSLAAQQDYNMRLAELQVASNEQISLNMESLGAALEEQARRIKITSGDVARSLIRGIGNGAGQAFAAFGRALASGENALDAFLQTFLQKLGQMAIEVGTMFILQGTAMAIAGLPNGGPLIAAGAALAAFGGIMGAVFGGGQGGGAGIGGIGGGVGLGGEPILIPEAIQEQQRTDVTVNIQGDVLDSDETGTRIVNLINDAYDKQGVIINRGVVG